MTKDLTNQIEDWKILKRIIDKVRVTRRGQREVWLLQLNEGSKEYYKSYRVRFNYMEQPR